MCIDLLFNPVRKRVCYEEKLPLEAASNHQLITFEESNLHYRFRR